jgi:NHS family xanthosine MFS transporter
VWEQLEFIAAMWITNLQVIKQRNINFILRSFGLAVVLGLYAFAPQCKPQRLAKENASLMETLGLESFKLLLIINGVVLCFPCFGRSTTTNDAYGMFFLE